MWRAGTERCLWTTSEVPWHARHSLPVRSVPRNRRLSDVLADLSVPEPVRRSAAAAALPPGAALCRRSASREHGLDLLMPDERVRPANVQCLVPTGQEPISRTGVSCFVSDLDGVDVVVLDGLPLTAVDRTLLDIARFERTPLALAILDRALAARAFSPPVLLARLDRLSGQRGVGRARRLITLADAGAESPGESWCRLRVVDAGFDAPETQIEVPRPGRASPFRLDMGWSARRKAVEYDGVEDHSCLQDRAYDAARRRWIEAQGWSVLVVGKGEVLGTRPTLELAVGELLGEAPRIRRTW